MKYRTKPFTIEAVRFDGTNHGEIMQFTNNLFDKVHVDDRVDDPEITAQVFDVLHSTWVGVKDGQWIIKGNKGEFYPCDPEIFELKYEAIDD